MPGEEDFVLSAFAKLRKTQPDIKLLIAPRHADRFDAVEEIIKRAGFDCIRRTQMEPGGDILLLDTFGELSALFQYATVVFVGGSLAPRGGHNVLEPAGYRKPIIFGPHMENFRDMARLFVQAGAARQIENADQLAPAVADLLSNPEEAFKMGRNAFAIVEKNTGATERVLQVLETAEAGR
jgi:3-deoxy-D-manno-octulosonic-acid transferase